MMGRGERASRGRRWCWCGVWGASERATGGAARVWSLVFCKVMGLRGSGQLGRRGSGSLVLGLLVSDLALGLGFGSRWVSRSISTISI